jgi:DNA-binding NarL/FixJ family response regulator
LLDVVLDGPNGLSIALKAMVRVVIVEDCGTQLDLCRRTVEGDTSLRLVAALGTAEEALATVDWTQVDVLLTDLELPGASGVTLIQVARAANPRIVALPLTVHDETEVLYAALEAGATGYLLKNVSPEDILRAIHDLSEGRSPISPSIGRHLIAVFQRPAQTSAGAELSSRELQVLRQMARGQSYKEIALALSISPHTVNDHLKNMYAKLRANNRADALRKARLLGYVPRPTQP